MLNRGLCSALPCVLLCVLLCSHSAAPRLSSSYGRATGMTVFFGLSVVMTTVCAFAASAVDGGSLGWQSFIALSCLLRGCCVGPFIPLFICVLPDHTPHAHAHARRRTPPRPSSRSSPFWPQRPRLSPTASRSREPKKIAEISKGAKKKLKSAATKKKVAKGGKKKAPTKKK